MAEKMAKIAMLLDIYGGILTNHQRNVLKLRYEEDLSLSEIAAQFDISRAAVQDIIRRAEAQLKELEKTIGALRLRLGIRGDLRTIEARLKRIYSEVSAVCAKETLVEIMQIVENMLNKI